MEAQVVRVADILGVELDSTIAVYYGPSAVEENCGEAGGCASSKGASGDFATIPHELVHAVRFIDGGVGTRFFEEGLAGVLQGVTPIPIYWSGQAGSVERGPAMLAMVPWDDFAWGDYPVAAHFVSWLRTEWGDEVLVPFLNDERYLTVEAVDEAFAEHFGLSIDEADSAWRATSAPEYVWGEVCDPARDLAWTGTTLDFAGEVACDLDTTLGPGPRPIETILTRSNCFVLESSMPLPGASPSPTPVASLSGVSRPSTSRGSTCRQARRSSFRSRRASGRSWSTLPSPSRSSSPCA
jgi:hypothetical protein